MRTTYQIQSRSSLEPLDLPLVKSVSQGNLFLGTILVLGDQSQVDTRSEGLEALNCDFVGGLELIVVRRVSKCQGKHSLLLQICLVDTGERTSDDSQSTEEAGFESGVFTGGTFAVVVITDDNPLNTPIAIVCCSLRDTTPFPSDLVLDLVGFVVLNVYCADQAVLRNVLEVTAVLEPGSTSRNVIGGWKTYQYKTSDGRRGDDVLHLPLTLIRIGRSWGVFPSQGLNGFKSCSLSEVGETAT